MKKTIKWFASFFEDQNGSASSKRLVTFIFCYFLFMIIKGELDGNSVSQELLFAVIGVILFGIGAATSEFFAKNFNKKDNDS